MLVDQRTKSLRGTAIVLAAGASVRFGSDKKFIPFAHTTLIQHTVELYASVFSRVLVVLREEENIKKGSFPPDVQTVVTANAHFGMSHSLRAGVLESRGEPWIVVGLMDMPYVTAQTLKSLVERMNRTHASVVRPRFRSHYGNPVGFKQECFSHLFELVGDQGARTLFHEGKFEIEALDVDDRGILIDIDTPEQLKEYATLNPLHT